MREIDLIPIRLHKGEPTWEIIDELLEHIDSFADETLEEFIRRRVPRLTRIRKEWIRD